MANFPSTESIYNQVLADKDASYKGSAVVLLSSFYSPNIYPPRAIDPKNVQRLKSIFEQQGLRRKDPENRIPVLLSQETFQLGLQNSNIQEEDLIRHPSNSPPLFVLPDNTVRYLHGHHRLAAAIEILPPRDQWWGVDIYLENNATSALVNYIENQYPSSGNITDGEIFRNIRLSSKANDTIKEHYWWSRLTATKRRELKQLLAHFEYRAGFDKLVDIPGLWPALKLGTLHRLLPLKCDEEICRYLEWVRIAWMELLDGDVTLLGGIDRQTVEAIELRVPAISLCDRNFLIGLINSGKIFTLYTDDQKSIIREKIPRITDRIPSLGTLFEDMKYLEPLATSMKFLIGPEPFTKQPSIYSSFEHMYQGDSRGSEEFNERYRMLWLFAMRNFPQMVSVSPRKERKRPRPTIYEPNHRILNEFAQLAHSLGFISTTINSHVDSIPEKEMAREFFRKARPEEVYVYDDAFLDAEVTKL
ncbi:hypothetical protein BDD12DRAFT_758374, partial [Trichophaea hybrida]